MTACCWAARSVSDPLTQVLYQDVVADGVMSSGACGQWKPKSSHLLDVIVNALLLS